MHWHQFCNFPENLNYEISIKGFLIKTLINKSLMRFHMTDKKQIIYI
jgi:hypothetical protein